MTEREIIRHLSVGLSWWRYVAFVPQMAIAGADYHRWEYGSGVADLVLLTRSLYLWEIEIKISLSDWRADAKKKKWQNPIWQGYVRRFSYAIPTGLAMPGNVMPTAGVIEVGENGRIEIVRPAKVLPAKRADTRMLVRIMLAMNGKIWKRKAAE